MRAMTPKFEQSEFFTPPSPSCGSVRFRDAQTPASRRSWRSDKRGKILPQERAVFDGVSRIVHWDRGHLARASRAEFAEAGGTPAVPVTASLYVLTAPSPRSAAPALQSLGDRLG